MGSINTKGHKKANSENEDSTTQNQPIFQVPSINLQSAPEAELSNFEDQAVEVPEVGTGALIMGNNEDLKRVIEAGRREIKETQEKLNSSLTTPIVDSEAKVCQIETVCFEFSADFALAHCTQRAIPARPLQELD